MQTLLLVLVLGIIAFKVIDEIVKYDFMRGH